MSDFVELKELPGVSDNNNVASNPEIEVIPGNGTTEDSVLLSTPQASANNTDNVDAIVVDFHDTPTKTPRLRRELRRVKESLNEVVVWKLRLWVVILIVLTLIILAFGITIIASTVEADADDDYDKSTFVVKRLFWGNFTLDKSTFTSHPEDQNNLTEQLKKQLTDVYSSSPALGRYFSNVTINKFQDAKAQFELEFLMPLQHDNLMRFTLSVKMVKNVLLQHFYDQDPGDPLHVIPTSLNMKVEDLTT